MSRCGPAAETVRTRDGGAGTSGFKGAQVGSNNRGACGDHRSYAFRPPTFMAQNRHSYGIGFVLRVVYICIYIYMYAIWAIV